MLAVRPLESVLCWCFLSAVAVVEVIPERAAVKDLGAPLFLNSPTEAPLAGRYQFQHLEGAATLYNKRIVLNPLDPRISAIHPTDTID